MVNEQIIKDIKKVLDDHEVSGPFALHETILDLSYDENNGDYEKVVDEISRLYGSLMSNALMFIMNQHGFYDINEHKLDRTLNRVRHNIMDNLDKYYKKKPLGST